MGNLNQRVFEWIYSSTTRGVLMNDLAIFIAQYLPYLLAAWLIIIIISLKGRQRRIALFAELALAILLSRGLITQLIYFLHPVARPFTVLHLTPLLSETNPSFPSGHATWLFASVVALWPIRKSFAVWFFLISILNGIARVYAGVHWPIDVLGGMVIGVISGLIVQRLVRPYVRPLNAPLQTAPPENELKSKTILR